MRLLVLALACWAPGCIGVGEETGAAALGPTGVRNEPTVCENGPDGFVHTPGHGKVAFVLLFDGASALDQLYYAMYIIHQKNVANPAHPIHATFLVDASQVTNPNQAFLNDVKNWATADGHVIAPLVSYWPKLDPSGNEIRAPFPYLLEEQQDGDKYYYDMATMQADLSTIEDDLQARTSELTAMGLTVDSRFARIRVPTQTDYDDNAWRTLPISCAVKNQAVFGLTQVSVGWNVDDASHQVPPTDRAKYRKDLVAAIYGQMLNQGALVQMNLTTEFYNGDPNGVGPLADVLSDVISSCLNCEATEPAPAFADRIFPETVTVASITGFSTEAAKILTVDLGATHAIAGIDCGDPAVHPMGAGCQTYAVEGQLDNNNPYHLAAIRTDSTVGGFVYVTATFQIPQAAGPSGGIFVGNLKTASGSDFGLVDIHTGEGPYDDNGFATATGTWAGYVPAGQDTLGIAGFVRGAGKTGQLTGLTVLSRAVTVTNPDAPPNEAQQQ